MSVEATLLGVASYINVNIRFYGQNIWLSQQQIAMQFNTTKTY